MNKEYLDSLAGILKSDGNFEEEMKQYKEEEKQLEEDKFNRIFKNQK